MKARLTLIAGIGLLLHPLTARADEWQFWPELDVFWSLNKSIRLVAIGSSTREPEIGSRSTTGVGAYLDLLAFQHRPIIHYTPDAGKHSRLDLRIGYAHSIDESGPLERSENRYIGQFQVRFQPAQRRMFYFNRNRFEMRDIEDRDLSWRFRNRSRLEDNVQWLGQHLTPYGMAEFFWDSRREAWSRGAYALGCEWSFPYGYTVLDVSMNLQDEWAPAVQTIWAPGLTLKFFF